MISDPSNAIDTNAPVGPQLYAILRQRIIRNDMPPGSRISETEVAARFAVSRQPVRETFIKLAEEGLLDVRPQRGTYVRKISTAAVMDARFIREAFEADIVRLLARDHAPDLDGELERQIGAQRAAAASDRDLFVKLDELFHRTLADAAGRGGAWRMVEGLKVQMDRVRYLSVLTFPMQQLLEQHAAIARAIAERAPDAADTRMRRHLRTILDDLPVIAREQPDFFTPSTGT